MDVAECGLTRSMHMNQFLESIGRSGRFNEFDRWRSRLIGLLVLGILFVAFLLITWNVFFVYVSPKQHLVIIKRTGDPLPAGHVLAEAGQKGVQRDVLGEGWHFVMPILFSSEREDNTEIPAGSVGIVTAKGGQSLPAGVFVAEGEEHQGIQRKVLTPGTYRVNKKGFDVEIVKATEIAPGFVGVQRRLLGRDGQGQYAADDGEKGILRTVLHPGLYYINTKVYDVTPVEVGIFQSTFHYDQNPRQDTAITFTSKGGFPIRLDCTVEWEVLPDDMPELVAEYGNRRSVELKVIDVQAHAIGRDLGIDYGVQEFLEGRTRERFQNEFTKQLTKVCHEKRVKVRSAFIRNIVIPEVYLKPIREKQIAGETELTNKAKEATAESDAEVERSKQMIEQRKLEVEAETTRLVAKIDRQIENLTTKTQAEVEKMKAETESQIAMLDAEQTKLTGGAKAEVDRLTETARASLGPLKLEAFQNDSDAYLRYSLSEQLNPQLVLRLFHAGAGTFWTNMGEKGMNFLMPLQSNAPSNTPDQRSSK